MVVVSLRLLLLLLLLPVLVVLVVGGGSGDGARGRLQLLRLRGGWNASNSNSNNGGGEGGGGGGGGTVPSVDFEFHHHDPPSYYYPENQYGTGAMGAGEDGLPAAAAASITTTSLHYSSADKETLRVMKQALESRACQEVLGFVGNVLEKLCEVNDLFQRDAEDQHRWKDTPFHTMERPALNISEYVARIGTHAGFSNISFIICLVYLDRLTDETSDVHLYVNSLTAHRLVIGGLLVAEKFTEDPKSEKRLDYAHVAKVAGMSPSELKHLEHNLLQALGHNAFVTGEELLKYSSGLSAGGSSRPFPPSFEH